MHPGTRKCYHLLLFGIHIYLVPVYFMTGTLWFWGAKSQFSDTAVIAKYYQQQYYAIYRSSWTKTLDQ